MYHKYYKFFMQLEENILDLTEDYSHIIILCIGTGKIVGDSIGPLIGENIKLLENKYIKIYGDLNNTINFRNAREILTEIYENFDKPYIITIDAALGSKDNIGQIVLNKGYIKIGKALEKNICFYSNINIKCVVGLNTNSKENNMQQLRNVEEKEVYDIVSIVSLGIKEVLKNKVYKIV